MIDSSQMSEIFYSQTKTRILSEKLFYYTNNSFIRNAKLSLQPYSSAYNFGCTWYHGVSNLKDKKLNNTQLLFATDGNHIIEKRMRAVSGYCESETCTKPLNQETSHTVGMCYGKIVLAYIEAL